MIEEIYVTGTTGFDNSFAVIVELEEGKETLDMMLVKFWSQGVWVSEVDIDFKAVDISPLPNTKSDFVIIGMDGENLWVTNAFNSSPSIKLSVVSDEVVAARTCIEVFQELLVSTGMGREVNIYNNKIWQKIGKNAPTNEKRKLVGFEALHFVQHDILFAVGWKGEIWRLSENQWRQIDSPSNQILTGVTHTEEGNIYICGKNGVIIKGSNSSWAMINEIPEKEDFWSITCFKNRVFVSSLYSIYEIIEDELVRVDETDNVPTFYKLSSNQEIMVSIGSAFITTFNGVSWDNIAS